MPKTSVSVRLESGVFEKLSSVAQRLGRPRSWVIENAVKDFIDLQLWQLAAIEEGLGDADAGRLVAHDKVAAWVDSWGRPDELPMPECK